MQDVEVSERDRADRLPAHQQVGDPLSDEGRSRGLFSADHADGTSDYDWFHFTALTSGDYTFGMQTTKGGPLQRSGQCGASG